MTMRSSRLAVVVMTLIAAIGSSPVRSAPSSSEPDPVRAWNEVALQTARVKNLSDARAARLYAMVNVAMFDAVNGIISAHGSKKGRDHALVPPTDAPPQGDIHVAASAAAHAVLTGEYPDQSAAYDAQLQADLDAAGAGGHTSPGETWGAAVGAQVRAARTNDCAGPCSPDQSQPAGAGPGVFRASWSGVQFRYLAPFGIVSPSSYEGTSLPKLDSLDYATAFVEVKVVGNRNNEDPYGGGADKLATFNYWSLGGGTSQPPGAWIQVARNVTDASPLPLAEKARLFALVAMAMSDSLLPGLRHGSGLWYRHPEAESERHDQRDTHVFAIADSRSTFCLRAGGEWIVSGESGQQSQQGRGTA